MQIICPIFNNSNFFAESYNSIKSKRHGKINYCVVDGLSTIDFSWDLIEAVRKTTNLSWVSQKDSGPAEALNTALKQCSSPIIGWLNADDYYAPGAIDRAIDYFNKNPKVVMVYGLAKHVDIHGKIIEDYPTLPPKTNINKFMSGNFICQPTVFFRREILLDIGYLDESLHTAFDFDYWVRIFKHYPKSRIGFIDEVQAYSRLHNQCLTKRLREKVSLEGMTVVAKHFEFAPTHWALTYFEELCSRFPLIEGDSGLVDILRSYLANIKPLIKTAEFDGLVKRLQEDSRLRLSKGQAFVDVYPDGWVSKKLVIKYRYTKGNGKVLSLDCAGGWPKPEMMNLKITSPDGSVSNLKVDSQESFTLNLEPVATDTEGFMAWTIETKHFFMPSEQSKKSKDARELSFKVLNLNLF